MHDPRAAEVAALRRKLNQLAIASDVDPLDVELTWLRAQLKHFADKIMQSLEPPKEPQWVMLPSGQCMPAHLIMADADARAAEGFHWEGNKPVFPAHWPKREV